MKRLLLGLAACGGSSSTPPDAPVVVDASLDASIDGNAGLPATCEGACRTTSVVAMLAATRTLDRAFYGVTMRPGGAIDLHVEVHAGGATGCPTQNSPTPDYSLILGAVPVPATTDEVTSPGNVLDSSAICSAVRSAPLRRTCRSRRSRRPR